MQGFLPYGRQLIEADDIEAVAEVLRGDFLTTGPAVDAFEDDLARIVDAPYAVVCSSGTAALHLACMAFGLGPGDLGIVPAITFVATANALRYCGAGVRFADVDPESGLSRTEDFEAALRAVSPLGSAEAKVLMPVHLNGQCMDPEAVRRLAEGRGLSVIEDACHALGARYQDSSGAWHRVGSCAHSDMAVFSFHPVKTIAAGEGGAITTRDPELYRRLVQLRSHGVERDPNRCVAGRIGSPIAEDIGAPWYHEFHELGYNYRLSDIHAALGRSQLAKLDRFVGTRRALARHYDARLADLGNLVRPVAERSGVESAYHLYAVRIGFEAGGTTRRDLMAELRGRGIGTQVHYIPVPHQPVGRSGETDGSWPGADRYYAEELSLPLFASMTTADVDYVVDQLAICLGCADGDGPHQRTERTDKTS